jgi:hypothetical protein
MKSLQIVPRGGTRLYGAMIRKQAEIRRGGRGTFSRVRARKHNAARWTHVRYKGSIALEPGAEDAVNVEIKSPERGDEARLLSSFSAGSTAISATRFPRSIFNIGQSRRSAQHAGGGETSPLGYAAKRALSCGRR